MKYKHINEIAEVVSSKSFYLFDQNKFIENFNKLENAFKTYYPKYKVAYSFKTNYCPRIVKTVNELGGLAEVVSDYEYEVAMKSGFSKNQIVYNGPVKILNTCIDILNNGGTVVIDNREELRELMICHTNKRTWNVGIRCNFDLGNNKISRFGFDVYSDNFRDIINDIESEFNLKLIHCHIGGARGLEYWNKRADEIIKVVSMLKKLPEVIDLGSGMFGEMEESFKEQFNAEIPTFDEYAKAIGSKISDAFKYLDEEDKPWLYTEPGTTIVANTMNFYCPVTSIKNVRGKDFIEVLGSIHNIGTELAHKKNLPCTLIKSNSEERTIVSDGEIVGYTCLEYDSLQRNINDTIAVGDYFEFRNVGSYSNVIKPPFIMPNFPIVVFENNKIEIIKRKEENEDLYRTYVFD